jgi:hypothetical protein
MKDVDETPKLGASWHPGVCIQWLCGCHYCHKMNVLNHTISTMAIVWITRRERTKSREAQMIFKEGEEKKGLKVKLTRARLRKYKGKG